MNPSDRRAELTATLTALPGAYALLPLFTLPGSKPADPERRTGTTSPARPPLALDVLDLTDTREKADADIQREDYDLDRRAGAARQGVLPNLVSWLRLVDEELCADGIEHVSPYLLTACTGACLYLDRADLLVNTTMHGPCIGNRHSHWNIHTVATACAWLLPHVKWIVDQRWSNELVEDAARMLEKVQRATGEYERVKVYRCDKPGCGWRTEGRDPDSKGRPTWYRCTGCGKTWAMHNEINRLMSQQINHRTLRACAHAVGRPVVTLKLWKSEGLIAPVGQDSKGHALYDLTKVEQLAAGRAERQRKAG